MYQRRVHALDDPREIRRLIDDHPWAVLVGEAEGGLFATHLPCLRDPENDGNGLDDLIVLGHVAKRDPIVDCLTGSGEVLLVFQGPHGYVSPSWYGETPHVGTWNFTVAHVYGVPEVLGDADRLKVLDLTQQRFERLVDNPVSLDDVAEYAQKIATATTAFRLQATRVQAKAKLSGDKPEPVQERVITALETPGAYENKLLAADMRRARRDAEVAED